MKATTFTKGDKKVMHAWMFYDWANSAYNLVIVSAIFPIFWDAITVKQGKEKILFWGVELNNDSLISYVTAAAFLVVVLLSPILSGIADYMGNKKFFLKLFCYLGAVSTMGLCVFNAELEHLYSGVFFYFLALIGFWCSLVFYNSYLPDIAAPEDQDYLSAKGFSYGYIGSTILLTINLIMVLTQEPQNQIFMMKISFVMVGVWWIAFSQYTYKYLPSFKNTNTLTKNIVFKGFKELKLIGAEIKKNKMLKRFLYAFFMYSMAVQTIMLIATYFGVEEIEWKEGGATAGLVISILLIQVLAIGGAFATSKLASAIGNINTLIVINVIWIMTVVYAYSIHSPTQFYITACLVGVVMGGIQSLSRSTYSKFLPKTEDTTSYFSFYDVTEKIGIIIGMLLYGYISNKTGSTRLSIVFFGLFFALGIILLLRVPKKKQNLTQ